MSTLSVTEAAEMMKVHTSTVESLIHSCTIPAARIGRAYVMLERDVLNYIEQQVIKQTSERMRLPKGIGQVRASEVSVA